MDVIKLVLVDVERDKTEDGGEEEGRQAALFVILVWGQSEVLGGRVQRSRKEMDLRRNDECHRWFRRAGGMRVSG